MEFLLTMMMSKSIQNQSLKQSCEVGVLIPILQMRKLRRREICILHKVTWPLSARAKTKAGVCLTLNLTLLWQRHGTESIPKGGWWHWCHPAATSATNLVHLPCARHSRGALPCLKRILGILGSLNYWGIGEPGWQGPGPREGRKLGSVQIVDHPSRRMCCQDAKHERTWSIPRNDKQSLKRLTQ